MKRTGRKGPFRIPYIKDKELFKAVAYAINMIRNGENPGIANARAASYYGYETSQVAHYVGIHASHKRYD